MDDVEWLMDTVLNVTIDDFVFGVAAAVGESSVILLTLSLHRY